MNHEPRTTSSFIILAFLAFLAGCGREDAEEAVPYEEKTLHPATLEDLQNEIRNSDATAVIVNMWASWCVPCREEFPDIIRVGREFDTEGVRIMFVSVDYEEDLPAARTFLREQRVPWESYIRTGDDAAFINAFHPDWTGALPATFLYDGNGGLQMFWEGKIAYEPLREAVLRVTRHDA